MAMTKGGSVPNAGTPGVGYPAPTPHAAVVAHQVYEAPTSGAGVGAGVDGANTDGDQGGRAGRAIDAMNTGIDPAAKNAQLGGGTSKAIEQPVMGDDSDIVYGSEYQPVSAGFGGGTDKALDEMEQLQPGTGFGDVVKLVATPDKGLDPNATGYGSASGTGNQPAGYDRRVVGGDGGTSAANGGWKSV